MSHRITRNDYAAYYGPTAGDKIRLGDTALVAEVERDCTVHGDENVYSGMRSLRDTMGLTAEFNDTLDSVITNVVIIDWTGIYKADIGIKNGRIAGIGKAGNPNIMSGVTPRMVIGSATEIISGEGRIATAGAIDANIALISSRQAESALSSGITTLMGGGAGYAQDFEVSTGTPGARRIETLMHATDDLPINFGFYAKAGASSEDGIIDQIRAGAAGLSLNESSGVGAASIECCMAVSIQFDLPVSLRPDPLSEAGGFDAVMKALNGRPAMYQLDLGTGGRSAQDGLRVCAESRAMPLSMGSARPSSINTGDEMRNLVYARRHMDQNNTADAAFADLSSIPAAVAAEDILHDLGAIPAISSGGMAGGRPGDLIARAWRTAHKMSQQRGRLPGETAHNDNIRIRRYIAKYTINPALMCGISHEVGSLENDKLADIVLWKPAFFGIKPECILKGGILVWGQAGSAGGGISSVQPVASRPTLGAGVGAAAHSSMVFVSKHSLRQNALANYNLRKKVAPVRGWRSVSKAEMRLNDVTPKIFIDVKKHMITADGEPLNCEPAENVPLAQRFALF
ncbi:MAG: urease subunit alpha [Planctomycetota bacterium]